MFSQTILVGHLGADPEIRYSPEGVAFCTLSLATGKKWKDKNTGEIREHTEWHIITVADKQAENCNEFLKKGSRIQVVGENQTQKWTDKQNVERWTTKIRARHVLFLDRKEGIARPPIPTITNSAGSDTDFDDDIPF